jgi:CDP-diacylglycerol---glycerol-3-phosphate 3-phosphatidyltransferase
MSIKPAGRDWRYWTPPNVVTTLRIVFFWVPCFLLLYFDGWRGAWTALLAFALLCATDFIDGWLAKCQNGKWGTKLGQSLDAVADKILIPPYIAAICVRNWSESLFMPIFVALLVLIAREFWLAMIQWYHGELYGKTLKSNDSGRDRMFCLCLTGLALTFPYRTDWWYQLPVWGLIVATYYFTVISSIDYVRSFRRIRRGADTVSWQEQPTRMRQLFAGGWKTTPNLLSLSRIPTGLLVMVLILLGHEYRVVGWVLVALVIGAGVTDNLDGKVARKRKVVSVLGAWLDPMADKILIGCALVGLAISGRSPLWVAVVILSRELAVLAMQTIVERTGGQRIPSSWVGKLKMWFQCIAVGLLCAPNFFLSFLTPWVVGLAVFLTVFSGLQYLDTFGGQMAARFLRG